MKMTEQDAQQEHHNVSDFERAASAAVGAWLIAKGIKRFSLGGLLLAGAGGALLVRGATGFCSLYAALGVNTARQAQPERRNIQVEHAASEPRSDIESRPESLAQYMHHD